MQRSSAASTHHTPEAVSVNRPNQMSGKQNPWKTICGTRPFEKSFEDDTTDEKFRQMEEEGKGVHRKMDVTR